MVVMYTFYEYNVEKGNENNKIWSYKPIKSKL